MSDIIYPEVVTKLADDELIRKPQWYKTAEGKRFRIRAAAHTIDILVYWATAFPVEFAAGFAFGFIYYLTGHEKFAFSEDTLLTLGTTFSLVLLGPAYFIVFEKIFGATPGKTMLSMRVVGENGTLCSLRAAILRSFLRYIDGLFFGVVAAMAMKPPAYQRLGDRVAQTIVVSVDDIPAASQRGIEYLIAAWLLFMVFAFAVQIVLLMVTVV